MDLKLDRRKISRSAVVCGWDYSVLSGEGSSSENGKPAEWTNTFRLLSTVKDDDEVDADEDAVVIVLQDSSEQLDAGTTADANTAAESRRRRWREMPHHMRSSIDAGSGRSGSVASGSGLGPRRAPIHHHAAAAPPSPSSPSGGRAPIDDSGNVPSASAATPDFRSATPDFRSATPDFRSATVDFRSATPDFRSAKVDFRYATPDFRSPTPDFRSAMVDFRSATPNFRSTKVDFRSVTPDYRSASPDFRSAMVDFRSATPDFRSATPDFRSPTPDFRSAMVDFRSATPDFRSTKVDFRSVTPDFRSASPDFRSAMVDFRSAKPDFRSATVDSTPARSTTVATVEPVTARRTLCRRDATCFDNDEDDDVMVGGRWSPIIRDFMYRVAPAFELCVRRGVELLPRTTTLCEDVIFGEDDDDVNDYTTEGGRWSSTAMVAQ